MSGVKSHKVAIHRLTNPYFIGAEETQIIIAGDLALIDSATVARITDQVDHIGKIFGN